MRQDGKHLTAMVALLGVSLMLGCGGDGGTGPSEPQGDDWLPLAVGNTWHAVLDGYLAAAGDTTDVDGTLDREVMSLTSHEQGFDLWELRAVSSMTFYPEQGTSYTITDTTTQYLYEDSTEIRGYNDTISTDYELILMLPLEVGNTWYPEAESVLVREVMSLSASVTVPAGSYTDCAHLMDTDATQPDDAYNIYLHRGVGLVKEVIDDEEPLADSHLEMELESFSLN